MPTPLFQAYMEILGELESGQHTDAYGMMECTVNGQPSIALVKRTVPEGAEADEFEVLPVMVRATADLEVKPIKGGDFAFIHLQYQRPN
jgi:hypothetical protein